MKNKLTFYVECSMLLFLNNLNAKQFHHDHHSDQAFTNLNHTLFSEYSIPSLDKSPN